MSYTNVWSDSLPTGSEAANTIATLLRQSKVDVEQRFMDIFAIPDFTVDPLRPYGLKFTDVQDAKLFFGDNAGTPRKILLRDKADTTTYVTLASTGITAPLFTGPLIAATATIASLTARNAGANTTIIIDGAPSANSAGIIWFATSNTLKSFSLNFNNATSGFAIGRSTLAGGVIYSADDLVISQTGNVSITNGLAVSGLIQWTAGTGLKDSVNDNGIYSTATSLILGRYSGAPLGLIINNTTGLATFNGGITVSSGNTNTQLIISTRVQGQGGGGADLLLSTGSTAGLIQFYNNGTSTLWGTMNGGVFAWGTTTVAGASGGIVLANSIAFSGVNSTNTSAIFLAYIDSSNRVNIGQTGCELVNNGYDAKIPATAATSGKAGTISWDASSGFLYLCTANSTWKRVAIASW